MDKRFEKFTYNITKLYRFIQKIKEIEVREYDLKSQHVMIIYYLHNHPEGLTSKKLTILCDEDKAAISRSVRFLEEKDLVFIDNKTEKKNYLYPIFLTDKGKEISVQISEKINYAVDRGGEGLTDEQRKEFYANLEHIVANLTNYTEGKK